MFMSSSSWRVSVLEAILGGLALGAVYALSSGGLILGFRTSGVLNFGYAAMAYFIARFYYFLHIQHAWGIAPAAVVSIVLVSPALGFFLWAVIFRPMRLASPLI
jgi:branched-chain amino acid transport system permease protein